MSYEGNEATIVEASDEKITNFIRFKAANLVIPRYVYNENDSNKLIYKVTAIGEKAFNENYSTGAELKGNLTIPDTVKTIGIAAFYTRQNYQKNDPIAITGTLKLPKNIESIGQNAFGGQQPSKIVFEGNSHYKLTDPNV